MPTSDSEDFESADEGISSVDKKERKKRLSSSNYSDNALEEATDVPEPILPVLSQNKTTKTVKSEPKVEESTDGWDDFDVEDSEPITTPSKSKPEPKATKPKQQDTGWEFEDWGDDNVVETKTDKKLPSAVSQEQNIQEVTERLAEASTKSSGGWGWGGWGVDSLLSTATAGITNITSQVSQGISTVLETGIGAPDPEELARRSKRDSQPNEEVRPGPPTDKSPAEEPDSSGDGAFPFGSLLSGVTKFVETTGTKVITGGLDTLETIGKKTMEVLQDGDPGLAKKKAMFGLDSEKPVLSQVLREAKAKADEEDHVREEKREAKEVHYETLFDDFEGLVHLEALEMVSRQVSMRIEERLRAAPADKRHDIKETLQQVAELCEMPEEDEDEDEPSDPEQSKADLLLEKLQNATQDLGVKLQFQPIVKQYSSIVEWSAGAAVDPPRAVYKRGVSSLAQGTALCVQLYHKAGAMLLAKPRRSTADEADALTQMTVVLTKHISEIATLFTENLNSTTSEDKEQVSTYITNIFLEAGNSATYIQNAFQLALPILQIGAV